MTTKTGEFVEPKRGLVRGGWDAYQREQDTMRGRCAAPAARYLCSGETSKQAGATASGLVVRASIDA